MPGLSIHVIDVAHGIPASGMRVELWRRDGPAVRLVDACVGSNGSVDVAGLATAVLVPALYEAVFHVGAWYRARGEPLPQPAFLDVVPFRFGVADTSAHYHLPLKMTPWGFSLFRGGA